MPLQNRVTPESAIVASPNRGLFMGNRGILHNASKRLQAARWRHSHWIICVLSFKGWHREIMQPGAYTELFFLDEATALAAGHRPCALCRRVAYCDFQEAVRSALHNDHCLSAADLDRMLHAARIESGTRKQRHFEANLSDLPDGTMVKHDVQLLSNRKDDIWLVRGHEMLRWQSSGYDRIQRRPTDVMVDVLTPRPTVLALKEGYKPALHPSAAT